MQRARTLFRFVPNKEHEMESLRLRFIYVHILCCKNKQEWLAFGPPPPPPPPQLLFYPFNKKKKKNSKNEHAQVLFCYYYIFPSKMPVRICVIFVQ